MQLSTRRFGPITSQSTEGLLDATNLAILTELDREPRLPTSELARRVGRSAPAVAERIARLQEAGVITGWRLDLGAAALGLPLHAYVRIRPAPGQLPRVARIAQQTPEIVSCDRVTGEDCFVANLHVRDVGHLEEVIDRFLAYGQTTTSIVQSSPVPRRSPPLPGAEPRP
ncbi:MAG: Lrp/AsnC family transcriptional regulator [Candidatus Dormiibacterota bacterium]